MISKDKKLEDEYNVQLLEYLASFWNPEAVSKIRQSRELRDDTRFMDDEEFDKSIAKEIWKDESIINTIKNKYKNTNLDDNNDRERKGARNIRLPMVNSLISDLIKK